MCIRSKPFRRQIKNIYLWVSLVAQLVKNLPAMWETWVQSLSWENPLKEGIAIHSESLRSRIQQEEVKGRAKGGGKGDSLVAAGPGK